MEHINCAKALAQKDPWTSAAETPMPRTSTTDRGTRGRGEGVKVFPAFRESRPRSNAITGSLPRSLSLQRRPVDASTRVAQLLGKMPPRTLRSMPHRTPTDESVPPFSLKHGAWCEMPPSKNSRASSRTNHSLIRQAHRIEAHQKVQPSRSERQAFRVLSFDTVLLRATSCARSSESRAAAPRWRFPTLDSHFCMLCNARLL